MIDYSVRLTLDQVTAGDYPSNAAAQLFGCFLDNFNNTPAFMGRQGTGLDDSDLVADCRAGFIMSHKLGRAADVAPVFRMLDKPVDPNDDCLLHFVRRNNANLLCTITA